ncbi:MAG: hypothetical protein HUJ96_10870 [Marinilabiliaceae bacterium]|nr:hypothetical protein [Marinilabiliaceae bacterium]
MVLFVSLFFLLSIDSSAQNSGTQLEQSKNKVKEVIGRDTLIIYQHGDTTIMKSLGVHRMTTNPHTATMFAAILPGLGQIYNRKYWKIPFVYGGIAALCYAIHFNGENYDLYRRSYRDFITKDPNNKAYLEVVKRTNLTVEECEVTYASWFQNALRNKKDYYRRYRDLSYFGLIGVYIIQIVDACVDAHFHNFDVSDELSMEWTPVVIPDSGGPMIGAKLAINF